MISQVKSFLCPDKQEISEEGWRVLLWPVRGQKEDKVDGTGVLNNKTYIN